MAKKMDFDTAPINELAKHVWGHWRETGALIDRALKILDKFKGNATATSAQAMLLEAPLRAHQKVTVGQMHQLLSVKASESNAGVLEDEPEQRKALLRYLQDSEDARAQAQTVLDAVR